jgi:hypothetical protein
MDGTNGPKEVTRVTAPVQVERWRRCRFWCRLNFHFDALPCAWILNRTRAGLFLIRSLYWISASVFPSMQFHAQQ